MCSAFKNMRVLLTSHGSTGDIYPMIALGRAMTSAGHKAVFATTPFFKEDIKAAGLDFLPLPPFDWGAEEFAGAMRDLHRARSPLRQLRLIYSSAQPYMAQTLQILDEALANMDLLVGSYLFPSFRGLAERQGAKFAVVSFCHNTVASPDTPPDVVPALSFLPPPLREAWSRLWWNVSERVLDGVMGKELGNELRAFGIPMQRGFCHHPADLALVAVSPGLMDLPGRRTPECFQFCGYLRYQSPDEEAFEETLRRFCDGMSVPVVTFGSVTWDGATAAMTTFLRNWPSEQKLILQAGWAKFGHGELPENVLKVGKCSHDQLFRHASAIMHHGGAGTTASALHAGVPQLVAPQIADQGFWASQVQRLGVGLRASPKVWPKQAPRLLQKLVGESAFKARAKECARVLADENGPQVAVEALESYIAEPR